jgi:hypothetical protein
LYGGAVKDFYYVEDELKELRSSLTTARTLLAQAAEAMEDAITYANTEAVASGVEPASDIDAESSYDEANNMRPRVRGNLSTALSALRAYLDGGRDE